MSKIFAIYRGDDFEYMGTLREVCEHYGVKPDTVWYWSSSANKRRIAEREAKQRLKGKKKFIGMIAVGMDMREEE